MNKFHRKFQFSAGDIMCARIAKSEGLFALGSSDKSIYIHDGLGKEAKSRLSNHPTGVESIGFDKSDVILVAGCSGGSVWLWDVEKEAQITSLAGHRSNCSVVNFIPSEVFLPRDPLTLMSRSGISVKANAYKRTEAISPKYWPSSSVLMGDGSQLGTKKGSLKYGTSLRGRNSRAWKVTLAVLAIWNFTRLTSSWFQVLLINPLNCGTASLDSL